MIDLHIQQERNISAADRLRAVVGECERDGRIEWLERFLKHLTADVSLKAEAHRRAAELERKGREEQLTAVRGWLAAQFRRLERRALSRSRSRFNVRTALRRRLHLDSVRGGMYGYADAISYGVTVSRRKGERLYYVVNIYEPDDYKPHPVEAWLFPRASYCGPEIDVACDRLARRLLGHTLNAGINVESLYLMVHKPQRADEEDEEGEAGQ